MPIATENYLSEASIVLGVFCSKRKRQALLRACFDVLPREELSPGYTFSYHDNDSPPRVELNVIHVGIDWILKHRKLGPMVWPRLMKRKLTK